MDQPTSPIVALAGLLPIVIAMGFVAAIIFLMAPRKGKSRAFAFLGMLPIVNMFVLIWLASLTDKTVLDAIEELKRKNA